MTHRLASLLLLSLLGEGVAAQAVYQCRQSSGTVVFSDAPCGANQQVLRQPGRASEPAAGAAPTTPPHPKRNLTMDFGGGDAITFVGGEGQFWCDDPRYAGQEIRVTWIVQGGGLSNLCELVPESERAGKSEPSGPTPGGNEAAPKRARKSR